MNGMTVKVGRMTFAAFESAVSCYTSVGYCGVTDCTGTKSTGAGIMTGGTTAWVMD